MKSLQFLGYALLFGVGPIAYGAEPTDSSRISSDGLVATAANSKSSPIDWPQFRGVHRDAISLEKDLLQKWPKNGPKLLWTARDLGRGYSTVSVVGDRIYTMGTIKEEKETVIALDAKTGKTIWATPIDGYFQNGWGGGPRGTPTIDGDYVYAISPGGAFVCCDAKDGSIKWQKHFVNDFGGKVPNWGYSESPLVDGFKVLATPGGDNCIVALDKESGATIWSSTGLSDPAQYSSIIRIEFGQPQYVTLTKMGVVSVSAKKGELLWRYEKTANPTAVIPTPIFFDKSFVYSTSGYGTGCGLVKLTESGSEIKAEEVYFNKNMKNHHGGVLLHEGHIYGFSDGVGWLCQNAKTGEIVWNNKNPADKGGLDKGSIAYGDDRLYCYGEGNGAVVLVDASPKAWIEHGRFTIPEHTTFDRLKGKVWAHPVIADGKLYLRDQELLFCYDIRK